MKKLLGYFFCEDIITQDDEQHCDPSCPHLAHLGGTHCGLDFGPLTHDKDGYLMTPACHLALFRGKCKKLSEENS